MNPFELKSVPRVLTLSIIFALVSCSHVFAAGAGIAGPWHGKLVVGTIYSLRIDITFTGASGSLSGTVTCPDQNPRPVSFDTVTQTGNAIAFTCSALDMSFSGTLENGGSKIVGTYTQRKYPIPLTLLRGADSPLVGTTLTAGQAAQFAGMWEGTLNTGKPLRFVLHIARDKTGHYNSTIDSPDQGASGVPSTFTVAGKSLNLEIRGVGASYEGKLNSVDKSISGTFKQRGHEFPLVVRKVARVM